jgi:hypothetical protein
LPANYPTAKRTKHVPPGTTGAHLSAVPLSQRRKRQLIERCSSGTDAIFARVRARPVRRQREYRAQPSASPNLHYAAVSLRALDGAAPSDDDPTVHNVQHIAPSAPGRIRHRRIMGDDHEAARARRHLPADRFLMREPRETAGVAWHRRMIARLLGRPSNGDAPVVGNLDGMHGNRLCGWAMDRREPRRRLVVTLEGCPGGPVAVAADRYRADLQRAGVGDGYNGFAVPLARPWPRLRLFAGSPPIELRGCGTDPPSPDPQRLHRSGSFALYLDNADPRSGISGWARDRDRPRERQTLRLCDGTGRILAEQRATHHRFDLEGADCDGFHGFAFLPIPESLAGPFRIEDAARRHMIALPG